MCFCYHGTSGVLAHYFHTAKKAASRMIPVGTSGGGLVGPKNTCDRSTALQNCNSGEPAC